MGENNSKDIYFGLGKSYAERVVYLPDLLKEGYYAIFENVLNKGRLSLDQEKKIKQDLELGLVQKKTLLNEKQKIIEGSKSNLSMLDEKVNKFIEAEKINNDNEAQKIDKLEKEKCDRKQKHYDLLHKEGKGEKGNLYKYVVILLFSMLTISLLMFYLAAWYNGVFGNVFESNKHGNESYINILNPESLLYAYQKKDYFSLVLAFLLTAIPMAASQSLHKGFHDFSLNDRQKLKEYFSLKYGFSLFSLFFSLSLDFILAYKIVEEIESVKRFKFGTNNIPSSVFLDVSFYLIILICIVSYGFWGHYLHKIIHFDDIEYEVKKLEAEIDSRIKIIKNENDKERSKLRNEQNSLAEDRKNVAASLVLLQKESAELADDIVVLEKKINDFDKKIKIVKSELEMAMSQFLSGFISACVEGMIQKKADEFKEQIPIYQEEKNTFINSIIGDDRYVII